MDHILDLKMQENDADAETVRDYLKALLIGVLEREDGFSGKRPFGNSGWKYELYTALVAAGVVTGRLDGGSVEEVDQDKADALILDAAKALR